LRHKSLAVRNRVATMWIQDLQHYRWRPKNLSEHSFAGKAKIPDA